MANNNFLDSLLRGQQIVSPLSGISSLAKKMVPQDNSINAMRAFIGQGVGMNWGDEAEAWLRSKIGQGSYEENLNKIRGEYKKFSEEHPGSQAGLELLGGALPAVATMAIPGGQIPGAAKIGSLASKAIPEFVKSALAVGVSPEAINIGQRMARTSSTGAGLGAFAGAGSGTEGNKAESAMAGGVLGAGIGAAIPPAFSVTGGIYDLAKKYIPTTNAAYQSALDRLSNVVKKSGMTPAEIESQMQYDRFLGVPTRLANVSPEIAELAEQTAKRSGKAAQTIRKEIEPDIGEASRRRVVSQVEEGIKPTGEYGAEMDNIMQSMRTKSKPLYEQAYEFGKVNDPEINQILKDPLFKRAYLRAKEYARDDMRLAIERGETIDPNQYAFGRVPTVRSLDYTKKAIDEFIERGLDGKPLDRHQASNAIARKKRMLEILDDQVPDYAKARATYAGDAEVKNALEMGMSDWSKMSEHEVKKFISNASPSEVDAFRTGVSGKIYKDIMSPSVDTNSAQKIIGSPLVMERIAPLFDNPMEFELFKNALTREKQLFDQSQNLLRSVETGRAKDLAAEYGGDPKIINAAVNTVYGPRSFLTSLAHSVIRGGQLSERGASKLSNMLMESDPNQVAAAVKILEERAQQAATSAERRSIGEVGTAAGVSTAWFPPTSPKNLTQSEETVE